MANTVQPPSTTFTDIKFHHPQISSPLMRSAAGNVLQKTQAQVDEVVDLMRENMDKVLGRDEKLLELDDRAQALQEGASQFESRASHLRRKYWWKNCKTRDPLLSSLDFLVIHFF
uniref:V-SNARE coiled-coil homology domain-containing protein n=1 Tax=Erpetoichthys calabaricus TaxID=27687 RepID=A0A8C4T7I8_ERPCA